MDEMSLGIPHDSGSEPDPGLGFAPIEVFGSKDNESRTVGPSLHVPTAGTPGAKNRKLVGHQ
jgi:hypothetical protein